MSIDINLVKLMGRTMPVMDKDICNGIAVKQSAMIDDYIHQIFRSAAESYPEGLEYVRYRRCTPYEEYRELTRQSKPRREFEMSRSDVYMNSYHFKFQGKLIKPRFIQLPFISAGGLLHLKGTQYKVTPILGGVVFNVEKGKVFMPTPRTPLCFERTDVSFMRDGKVQHACAVSSALFNMAKADRSKLNSTLIHYMLAEYGLTETLRKIYKINIKLGGKELDSQTEEYHIYSSRQMPPLKVPRGGAYTACTIRIAVLRSEYYPIIDSIIGGVFYIMDQCADSCQLEDLDTADLWLRLLPRFIFAKGDTGRTRYEEMVAHLDSVKRSMDTLTKRRLELDGIHCDDIFSLFHYMTCNIDDIVIHHDVGTMYDQELTTVRHLLHTVVHNIFHCMFELKKLQGDRITEDKIVKVMDSKLRKDRILSIEKHGELSADTIASDCKVFGATCNVISQSKASSVGRRNKHNKGNKDPSLLLHPSQVEVGSYLMMSKSEPSGRSKLNPFLYFSEGFLVRPRPELEQYIEGFKGLISEEK